MGGRVKSPSGVSKFSFKVSKVKVDDCWKLKNETSGIILPCGQLLHCCMSSDLLAPRATGSGSAAASAPSWGVEIQLQSVKGQSGRLLKVEKWNIRDHFALWTAAALLYVLGFVGTKGNGLRLSSCFRPLCSLQSHFTAWMPQAANKAGRNHRLKVKDSISKALAPASGILPSATSDTDSMSGLTAVSFQTFRKTNSGSCKL